MMGAARQKRWLRMNFSPKRLPLLPIPTLPAKAQSSTPLQQHHVCGRERTGEVVRLSGYEVELQMKSTEYKAQDDTKLKQGEDADDEGDVKDEVEGFLFNTLKQLHPEKVLWLMYTKHVH